MLQSVSPIFRPRALDFFMPLLSSLWPEIVRMAWLEINSAAGCQLGRSLDIISAFQF